jgi:fatty acid desaturase
MGRTVRGEIDNLSKEFSGSVQGCRTCSEEQWVNGRGFYITVFVILMLAWAGTWSGFLLLRDTWFQLLIAAGMGVVLTQFAFLAHEAAHRQGRWVEIPVIMLRLLVAPVLVFSLLRYLNDVGLFAGEPFECPVVDRFRPA